MTELESGIVGGMPSVCVIMTVFNRIDMTVACLDGLFLQAGAGLDYGVNVVVVDDASQDATIAVLQERFGNKIEVIETAGNLFWSKGMSVAQRRASSTNPDFILWLNNDVILEKDAIARLLKESSNKEHQAIIVGAMKSESTGLTSYSGFKKLSSRPGHFEMIIPTNNAQPADSLNGNLVLVPRAVYRTVGAVDDQFSHAYGDLDYGMRARKLGFEILVAPNYLGRCDRNPIDKTWEDRSLTRRERFRHLFSRKGLPIQSHIRFVSKHSRRWPAFVAITYLRRSGRILLGR